MSRPWRDPETLRELYHEKGYSLRDIADELDCTPRTVNVWMQKCDVERRPSLQEKPVNFGLQHGGYESWTHTTTDTTHHVLVHRLLAVAEYGIEAIDGRIVHHRNNIPWDNRPENLEIMTQSEHVELHGNLEVNHG